MAQAEPPHTNNSIEHKTKAINTGLTDKRRTSDIDEVPEKSFWKKVKSSATAAGHEAIYNALVLYYTARAKETPVWCKTVIAGALGYFISLIDAIPDLTPILGYTDDVAIMIAAISALATHITPEIKQKAKDKSDTLFGK